MYAQSNSRRPNVDLLSLSISRCWYEGFDSDATLENSLLRFHSHLSHLSRLVSQCRNDVNSGHCIARIPELFETPESSVGDRFAIFDPKLIIGFDFATTRSLGLPSCCPFDMILDLSIDLKMTAGKDRKTHNVEHTEKVVPFIMSEVAFGQQVSKSFFFGVSRFDLDLWVQVDSIKQPIKRNSVGSGHVSHRRTSASDDHLDRSVSVFENMKLGFKVRKSCACNHVTHSRQFINFSVSTFIRFGVWGCFEFHCAIVFPTQQC